jgi:hypothetical protein
MSLESELEPKLTKIDEAAREQYSSVYLDSRGLTVIPGTATVDFNEVSKGNVDPIWEVGMVVPQPTEEDRRREQEAYNGFLQSLEDLKNRFRSFYALGEPVDFALMTSRLGTDRATTFPTGPGALTPQSPPSVSLEAPTVLASVMSSYTEHMDTVAGMIDKEDWSGTAARTFHTDFLEKYLESAFWQSGYVHELGKAVQIYHDAVKKGREDVLAIADLCHAQMYPTSGGSSARTLGIISLITSAMALYPPFGIGAGVTSLSTGLVSFIESETASEETSPVEVTITGGPGDIPEVLWSTWNALGKVDQALRDGDQHLSRGLENDLNNTSAFASPHLRLPRPALSDNADQQAPLGQLDFIPRPGVSIAENPLVVELVDVYQAGYVNLPNAARCYNDAAAGLNDCDIPGPLSSFFPQSIPKFNTSRDGLSDIFADTRDALNDAGEALVNTANGYQVTDEERGEVLRRIQVINMLYPPPVPAGG